MKTYAWHVRQIILRLFYALGMLASVIFLVYMLFLKIMTFSVVISVVEIFFLAGALLLFFVLLGHLISRTRPFMPFSEWRSFPKK